MSVASFSKAHSGSYFSSRCQGHPSTPREIDRLLWRQLELAVLPIAKVPDNGTKRPSFFIAEKGRLERE